MSQERLLIGMAMLYLEKDMSENIDVNVIINEFSSWNAQRNDFYNNLYILICRW